MSLSSLLNGARQAASSKVSLIGHDLHLPEFGISEAIAPTHANAYSYTAPTAQQQVTTTGSTAPTGATTGTAVDPTTAANNSYYTSLNGQVDNQLGRIGGQTQTGLDNILRTYQQAFNTLTNQQNQATRDYTTQKDQTQQDNLTARNNIDTGVRQGLNGLKRLLGANGAGSSSAANVLAPYAAGLEGNNQRQAVSTTFGRNMGALDTNYQDAQNQFNTAFSGLQDNRVNQENALRSGMADTQAKLLAQKQQNLASMGRAIDPAIGNQINDLGRQIDGYGALQVTAPTVQGYAKPNLDQYNYDATAGPTGANATGAASNLGAYYSLLNAQDKKKQLAGAA